MHVAPLTGKQLDSVRLATARLNIWEGSVRSSKTISSLIAWLKFVREAPPGNLLFIGKTERTLKRNIIDPLTEILGRQRCNHVVGAGEVWLLGRRVYTAGAHDEGSKDKIQGMSLVGCYADELSTMPQSFWPMLTSRLSEPGARLFGTSNPASPAHWLMTDVLDRASLWLDHDRNVLRYEGEDRLNLARFSFRIPDNPHLPAEYVRSLDREYTGLWHKRYFQGLWVAAEGAVYDMWDPDSMVTDVLPPVVSWLCCAVDYGTTNPTHALLLGIGADERIYVTDEWRYDSRRAHRQLSDAEYSQRIRAWLQEVRIPATRQQDGSWLRGVRPHYMVVDPSAASFRVQLHQDGMPTAAANNEVLDGIRTVSSLMTAGKLRVARDCTALLAELPGYAWDDKAAKLGEDKPVKVADHGADALRYGVYTTRSVWQSQIRLAQAA